MGKALRVYGRFNDNDDNDDDGHDDCDDADAAVDRDDDADDDHGDEDDVTLTLLLTVRVTKVDHDFNQLLFS